MVESVSASEAYQEFEKRNNRFVNMLAENVSTLSHLTLSTIRTVTCADKGLKASESHSQKRRIQK
jgi:hypothetical protein